MNSSSNQCILFVDTSHNLCLALYSADTQQCLFSKVYEERRAHEKIQEALDSALEQTGYSTDSIQSIVVATGPGSFTGLRIGIAFCQGLSFAKQLPIFPISTLEIMTESIPKQLSGLAVIPANKGQFYLAFSNNDDFDEEYLYVHSTNSTSMEIPCQKELQGQWSKVSHIVSTNPSSVSNETLPTELQLDSVHSIYEAYPFQDIIGIALKKTPVANGILKPNYIQPPAAKPSNPANS